MDNPGFAWAVILNNPELRQGLIREAAGSHRSDRSASNRPTPRRWLGLVVRRFDFHPESAVLPDAKPTPAAGVE
jgi:hypothetical protein